jgi:hypothetical protein
VIRFGMIELLGMFAVAVAIFGRQNWDTRR